MIHKLGQSAERNWRRLRGFERLTKVVEGAKLRDGVEVQTVVRLNRKQQPGRVAA
jgi:putative transposase